jgi:cellulose synthase/poly-beta-1,6-N-acetylglucosamine synthase-like glycosyltransferase
MSLIHILFWSSGFFVFYAYLGYPVTLRLISFFKKRSPMETGRGFEPRVTMLISVYNEEKVIEDKIRNTLDLDYPADLLEVIVVSDGSSDRTDQIVSSYADKGIQLRSYEGRIGKTACLNKTIPDARGSIIVFSDANSQYNKSAVKELAKHFADKKVGFVTGWTRYLSGGNEGEVDSLGIYARIELETKVLESMIGSCVGADGAIFAIRKELYQPLRPTDINDFVIPLRINQQGYRGLLEKNAFCSEKGAGEGKGEFFRQVRITNRTIRAIFNNAGLLNPMRYGLFSFELFSHKVCKFLVPFFLLLAAVTNILLVGEGTLYVIVFGAQSFFYLSAWMNGAGPKVKYLPGLTSLFHTFVLVNAAIFWAWITYLRGETFTTWVPTQR